MTMPSYLGSGMGSSSWQSKLRSSTDRMVLTCGWWWAGRVIVMGACGKYLLLYGRRWCDSQMPICA